MKKSEASAPTPDVPAVRGEAGSSGWSAALRANWPIPLLLAALVPLGWVVESRAVPFAYQRIIMLAGFNIILAVGLQLINGFSGQFSLGHAGFMAVGAYLAAYPAIVHSKRFADPFTVALFYIALFLSVAVGAAVVYGVVAALRASRRVHVLLPGLLLMAVIGWFLFDVAAAARYDSPPIWTVWTRGVALLRDGFAWTMTHGTPAAAKISSVLPDWLRMPFCFVLLVLGGGGFAAAAGLVVGLPTLRLRGDYLAIATLGMAEIIRVVIQNSEAFGGALGLTGIPKATNFAWLYGVTLLTVVAVWRVAYSPRGRAIMAVREDEIAAAAVGIDTTRQKVTAFVLGAFFAGVAGALFALHERSLTPGYFGLQRSIEIVAMVTLGGLGSVSGAILAAIVLTLLPELLRQVADYRMIVYSLLLIGMMLLRPQGLLGGRELWPRGRRAPRAPSPTNEPGPTPTRKAATA